nr:MAG: hypothetical protein [Porcellio scaber clopovirus]
MASVRLNLYKVEFLNKIHTVVEFASPISFAKNSGAKWVNYNFNDSREDIIVFTPPGYFRPITNDDPLYQRYGNEKHFEVQTLEEFLYFPIGPEVLVKYLSMALYISKTGHNLQLEIVHKKNDVDLKILSHRMIPRWVFHIRKRMKFYRKDKDELDCEYLKLSQSIFIMKTMVESWYQIKKREIEKSLFSSIHYGIHELELKCLIFNGINLINSLTNFLLKRMKKGLPKSRSGGGVVDISKFLFPIRLSIIPFEGARKEEEFDESSKKDFVDKLQSIMKKLGNFSEDEISDNRCRVTFDSTIQGLRDPRFLELLNLGKKAFLWYFSITGIPIMIERKNHNILSVWKMLLNISDRDNKFPVVSHKIVNSSSTDNFFKNESNDEKKRYFVLDENTRLNGVVPIFTPKVVATLKPLIGTNLFASICTFSILNNPNEVFPDIHLVALLCLWIKLIISNNKHYYQRRKLSCLISTASIYLNHPDHVRYKKVLINSPELALGEEAVNNDNVSGGVKSENLVKPLFFMFVYRDEIEEKKKIEILTLIVREFVGRLISDILKNTSLERARIRLFILEEGKEEEEEELNPSSDLWKKKNLGFCAIKRHYLRLGEQITEQFLDDGYYNSHPFEENREMLLEILKVFSRQVFRLDFDFRNFFGLNMEKLLYMKNEEDIGDFTLNDLVFLARIIFALPEEAVDKIFGEENLFRIVYCRLKGLGIWEKTKFDEELISYEDAYNGTFWEVCKDFKQLVIANVVENLKYEVPARFENALCIW